MRINSQGTVIIPKKGKKYSKLLTVVDVIMIASMDKAIIRATETKNCLMVEFEHGQIKTPKDVATKLKIGDRTLLRAYKLFEGAHCV